MILFLITILLAVILIVTWLLMVPVAIVFNTAAADYRIEQAGTFRFRMFFEPSIRGELSILGIRIRTRKRDGSVKKKPREKTKKSKGFRRGPGEWISLGASMIRAFRVNRLIADVDTGDVVTNAKLVPAFLLVSRSPAHLTTNFEGRVLLDINVSFYVYKAVVAFLRFKLKI